MPLLRLYPFLQCEMVLTFKTVEACVNALARALSISTLEKNLANNIFEKWCQCPCSGFIHFYEMTLYRIDDCKSRVSMPLLGLYPFLLEESTNPDGTTTKCVNALARALSISTKPSKEDYFVIF